MPTIGLTDHWRLRQQYEAVREFFAEEIGRCWPVAPPPFADRAYLRIGFRCRDDRKVHRRVRNSSMISDARRTRPALTESQERASAACSAARSASVRSSPSSSATRSTTVPSGSVVGSSRTSRPFSTRARKLDMAPLYDRTGTRINVRNSARVPQSWRNLAERALLAGLEYGGEGGIRTTAWC
jgi:hypothetical protein